MSQPHRLHPPLADALWPAGGIAPALRALLLIAFGSLLLTVSAKLNVPMWPVPMTMQTFVVLLLGLAYGWPLGAATVAVYLAQGAIGLPVFAGGGGLAYLAGTTGGYLVGFFVAAAVMGLLAERGWGRGAFTTLAAMLIGTALILGLGVAWLAWLIGVERALVLGLYPFLPGEAVKIALAVLVLPLAWKRAARS